MKDLDSTVQQELEARGPKSGASRHVAHHRQAPRRQAASSSVSAGDDGGDTWTPAPQSSDPGVYAKQQMALSLVYTLPGAPTVYYGPVRSGSPARKTSSRRVMPAGADLTDLREADPNHHRPRSGAYPHLRRVRPAQHLPQPLRRRRDVGLRPGARRRRPVKSS